MMVTDACFILEFIHEISAGSTLPLQDQYIPYDLVLLENQIPFFVLKGLYECVIYKFGKTQPLAEFIQPLLKYANLFKRKLKVCGSSLYANLDHILGLLHHCYQSKNDISSGFPSSTIHSAVELDRVGVNFMPNQDAKWPMAMEVKFIRSRLFWFLFKPTLTMPTLRINDFTE
ncbi:hypothetical protein HanRHA438_Chr14g0631191 [Helianthus annuus]|uniref:Uncharacterized protein n=2 Tax=Helianthus annuus TaxID=4232 RepID=A0A251SDG7_HELAN|nr:hypothetical protein HanRHA438_Chr14g0631191 [Helianthus annuus]